MSTTTTDTDGPARGIQSDLADFESLIRFLAVVPDILSTQHAQTTELEERLDGETETIEDLRLGFRCLVVNLYEAECEIETLRGEVASLRDEGEPTQCSCSTPARGKEDTFNSAQRRDPSEIVEVGDTLTVTVDDTSYEAPHPPSAIAHIDGLVTFVPMPRENLTAGDEIEVRISDLGDTFAHAVKLEVSE